MCQIKLNVYDERYFPPFPFMKIKGLYDEKLLYYSQTHPKILEE